MKPAVSNIKKTIDLVLYFETCAQITAKDLAIITNTRFSTRLSKLLNIPVVIMVAIFAALLLLGVMKILQTGA